MLKLMKAIMVAELLLAGIVIMVMANDEYGIEERVDDMQLMLNPDTGTITAVSIVLHDSTRGSVLIATGSGVVIRPDSSDLPRAFLGVESDGSASLKLINQKGATCIEYAIDERGGRLVLADDSGKVFWSKRP